MENKIFESTVQWVFLTSDLNILKALKTNDSSDCVMLFYDYLSESKNLEEKSTIVLVANNRTVLKSMYLMFRDIFPDFFGEIFIYYFR